MIGLHANLDLPKELLFPDLKVPGFSQLSRNKIPILTVLIFNFGHSPKGGGHVQENAFCPADSLINFRSL